jgi:HKD family nuclease
MSYTILNNLINNENHFHRLKDLFTQSDTIFLASPFLMPDFTDFLSEVNLDRLKKIEILTTLPPCSFEQIKKITSLISLIEFPPIKNKEINCTISVNNKLHGKIYIFKANGSFISAIISSANFTGSGLSRNHEWGIEIFNKTQIEQLLNSIQNTIEFSDITFDELRRMYLAATDFLAKDPQTEQRNIDLVLTDFLISANWKRQLASTNDYWLKPIGVSDMPVTENRLFNELNYNLHFSKQRPNGVKPNDVLICYGVGTTKILSVYKATSFPIKATDEEIEEEGEWLERWPWYVEAQNLTPSYGETWFQHNLYKHDLLNEYLKLYPDKPITAVGNQTLGALNFGKDKLKLDTDFAKFIISKVVEKLY